MPEFAMTYEAQLARVGILYLDVMMREELTLPSDVTRYPVEDGSEDITDHITRGNEELVISGAISHATSFGMEFDAAAGAEADQHSKLIDAIDQLRLMHRERRPVTVTTGLGNYTDMAFTQLSVTRQTGQRGGNWIDVNATLRQIKRVSLREAELPPERVVAAEPATKGKVGQTERKASKTGTATPAVTEPVAAQPRAALAQMFPGAEGPRGFAGGAAPPRPPISVGL